MCIGTCTYTCWCGTIIDLTLCLEHRRAVERLIEERRAQFQAEKEAELEERKEEERREADRRAIIEQERQRLLQEHASKLLWYLPKVSHSLQVFKAQCEILPDIQSTLCSNACEV